jgi:hypothetical protein
MNGAFFSGGGYLRRRKTICNSVDAHERRTAQRKRLLSPRTVELMRSPFIPAHCPAVRGEFGLSMRVVTDPVRGVALSAGALDGWRLWHALLGR